MSPRFQRRPERRSGSGGSARPPAGGRGWGGGQGKPEWRPRRSDGDGEGSAEGGYGGARRGPGAERPQRRFDQRPGRAERPIRGDRFKGRSGPREEARDGSSPREPRRSFGERRPFAEKRTFTEKRTFAERRSFAERRPFGERRVFDKRRPLEARGPGEERPAQGEAQTLGSEPPSDLIWGRHPAQAALESGRPVHRIWCTPELRHTPRFLQLLREAKASGVLVEEVTWARLGQLTGGAVHQGIVLQSAAAETLDLASLIEGCSHIGEPPLLMAIDGLTDPHNLGAIVRSAEALGAHGMVLPQRRCAGLTGSVAKVAAGALEHLPVARVVNLNRALDSLKQEGYRVVGLAAEGSVSLEEADLDGPLVVVTGSEGDGLSLLTRRSCDQLVRIPLRGATPSLNASVATALLLYEVARRSWMRGLSGQNPAPRIVRPQLPSRAAAVPSEPEPELEAELELEVELEVELELEAEPLAAAAETPMPEALQHPPADAPAEAPAFPGHDSGPAFASDIRL